MTQTKSDQLVVTRESGIVTVEIRDAETGETYFRAHHEWELWRLRAWLRELREVDSVTRIRASQKLEQMEAEVVMAGYDDDDCQPAIPDWAEWGLIAVGLVVIATAGWMVLTYFGLV